MSLPNSRHVHQEVLPTIYKPQALCSTPYQSASSLLYRQHHTVVPVPAARPGSGGCFPVPGRCFSVPHTRPPGQTPGLPVQITHLVTAQQLHFSVSSPPPGILEALSPLHEFATQPSCFWSHIQLSVPELTLTIATHNCKVS